MLNIGTVVGGAFRLIMERPLAVLAWGVAYTIGIVAIMLLTAGAMIPQMGGMMTNPQAMMANLSGFFMTFLIMGLLMLLLISVVMTAPQRAILRPNDSGFAFLRIGGDEIRMCLVALALFFLFLVGYIAEVIVLMILVAIVGVGGGGAAAVVAVVGGLAMLASYCWAATRLSLAYPLTLMRGNVVIGESWRLTRGHFWPLFLSYLVIFVIYLIVAICFSMLMQGSYWTDLMRYGANSPEMQQAAARQMQAYTQFGTLMIVYLISSVITSGLMIALFGGAAATAARELAGPGPEVADTFA